MIASLAGDLRKSGARVPGRFSQAFTLEAQAERTKEWHLLNACVLYCIELFGPRLIDGRWVLSALTRQVAGFGTFLTWDDLFGASKTIRVLSNIIIYSVNINMWGSVDIDTDIDTGVNTRRTVNIIEEQH